MTIQSENQQNQRVIVAPKVRAALTVLPDHGLNATAAARIEDFWQVSRKHRNALTPTQMARAMEAMIQRSDEAEVAAATVARLLHPASRQWVSGRIATLLVQFYTTVLPEEVHAAIARDWIEALDGLPGWAIQRACAWWIGPENPDLGKRPLPGHIARFARDEMGGVRMIEAAIRDFSRRKIPCAIDPAEARANDAESRARIAELVRSTFPSMTGKHTEDPAQEDA